MEVKNAEIYRADKTKTKSFVPSFLPVKKSKALPIYDPNFSNDNGKILIKLPPVELPIIQPTEITGTPQWRISTITLMYDPPMVGTEISVYVYLMDQNNKPRYYMDLFDLDVRWFRGIKRICSFTGCNKVASLQCICCMKLKISQHNSFFCNAKHLKESWGTHKLLHSGKTKGKLKDDLVWTENDGQEGFGFSDSEGEESNGKENFNFQFALNKKDYERGLKRCGNLESVEALSRYFPPNISNIWADRGNNFTYVPTEDDAGRQLLVECSLLEKKSKTPTGIEGRCWTSPVLPRFEPPPDRLFVRVKDIQENTFDPKTVFRVISFNVLADIYAKPKRYPYIHSRYLNWNYRQDVLMKQINQQKSQIICLQEVQFNHYTNYFLPHLKKMGYDGLYKKKTRLNNYNPDEVDGCAVFFDTNVFHLVQQFTIEFNEAAEGLFNLQSSNKWEEVRRRLTKDNVAVVCILENIVTKRRLCVANTHVYWDPLYADVKLWQSLVLCQELQALARKNAQMISSLPSKNKLKIAQLPMLICGDFNSTPNSAVYKLLTTGCVPEDDSLVSEDKLGIFHKNPPKHDLKFKSAYKTVMKEEPKFTNYTSDFKGCIDYIMYSSGTLKLLSVLEMHREEVISEHNALPSPRLSSDHLPLVADFAFPSLN